MRTLLFPLRRSPLLVGTALALAATACSGAPDAAGASGESPAKSEAAYGFSLLNYDIVSATGGTLYFKENMGSNTFWSFTNGVDGSWGAGGYNWAGDFDGDGYWDLAAAIGSQVYVKLNRQSGFVTSVWPVADGRWGGADYTYAADFNGDGKVDLGSMYGGQAFMKLSTGSSFVSETWSVSNEWGGGSYTFAADFNHDGKADIASAYAGLIFVKFSNGSAFTDAAGNPGRSTAFTVANTWGGGDYTFVGDFDCNGLPDIASFDGGVAHMKFNHYGDHNLGGQMFYSRDWTVSNEWGGSGYTRAGDFNNDGCADIASANGNTVYLKFGHPATLLDEGLGASAYLDSQSGYIAGAWGAPNLTFAGRFSRPGS